MQKGLEQKQKDFWPVGSIYQTFNDEFDPNLNWQSKWIKVEGKFILGSSNLHKINSVRGEETHLGKIIVEIEQDKQHVKEQMSLIIICHHIE